ncbi:MAG: hypothetical protein VZS44_07825 [Bacilli bacterium]|nr:hypothetical protein [Bacilli bacterium]
MDIKDNKITFEAKVNEEKGTLNLLAVKDYLEQNYPETLEKYNEITKG